MKIRKLVSVVIALSLVAGCAGFQRGCSSWNARAFGSDWIVVQYRADGTPINCWSLTNTSISNESQSDGIYWLESTSGHLVHISGWYNRVQVNSKSFEAAANLIGVDIGRCQNGIYGATK